MIQKPVACLKALGTYRNDRHAKRFDNVVSLLPMEAEIKIPPEITDEEIQAQYRIMTEQLKQWNILAGIDLPLLEQAFVILQEIKRINKSLSCLLIMSEDYGKLLKYKTRYLNLFHTIVGSFGVSPKARTKLILNTIAADKNKTLLDKIKEKQK